MTSTQRFTRRDSIRMATVAAAAGWTSRLAVGEGAVPDPAIRALVPRGKSGHQFLLYSDCCSGIPDSLFGKNLARMNRMVSRLHPPPEFVAFPGDAVSGYTTDYDELRRQWDYWQQTEMKWLAGSGISLYQSTSNHNTYDVESERVFREKHPELPQNGPEDQQGLAYYVRRGDLLYISTHQPDRRRDPAYRPGMQIDHQWLDRVLGEHDDARYKLVAGHYPVFPINGYVENPQWCLMPDERAAFWSVLVKHGVTAYLGSHVIAFDVQVHDGVPQIISGGAGTNYGPGGFMPSLTEYLHAVQMAIDADGFRYQVLDVEGKVRERLSWPFSLPAADQWQPLTAENVSAQLAPKHSAGRIIAWRFQGQLAGNAADAQEQTLLCGFDDAGREAIVWIGLAGEPARLVVRLMTDATYGLKSWTGPSIGGDLKFDFQLALHPGMGPGGVLWRRDDSAPWSSLDSPSAKGAEDLRWPATWSIGRGRRNVQDKPFLGDKLVLTVTHCDVPGV